MSAAVKPVALSLSARVRALGRKLVGATAAAQDDVTAPIFPRTPFATWDYEQAADAVEEAVTHSELDATRAIREASAPVPGSAVYFDPRALVDQLTVNRAFFEGDHWQMGSGWIGPHPAITDKDYVLAMNEVVNAFTSKNVIREVVKRHASGVIGKEPTWSYVPRRTIPEGQQPTTEETAAVAEANRLLKAWWDARKVRSLVHDAVCTLLFGARAPLRLYVPAGLIARQTNADGQAETVVRAGSIEQALGMIWPDHPRPEHAAVVIDEDTKMEAGVRLYTSAPDDADDDSDDANAAPGTGAGNSELAIAELVFLDEQGDTVVRLLEEDADTEATPYQFAFGARLTMLEMRRDPLVTPQVTQQQRALNLALSMLPRNIITGGFLERVLLDAEMPGKYEPTPDGLRTRFVPDPLVFGPNTTNFFAGLKTKNADGSESRQSPTINYRDPVPVDAPVAAAHEHYLAILDEVSQLHVVLSGDAVVSGKSRDQARAEFVKSLGDTIAEVESALRFLLETPLAMAEALSDRVGALTSLVRVTATCKVDAGPLDAAERTANEASIGKTLSRETAMARNDVDDVDAELARMADDPLSIAVLVKAQGDAMTAVTSGGASVETAAALLKLDPKIAAALAADRAAAGFAAPLKEPKPENGPTAPAKPVDRTPQTGGPSSQAGGAA